MIYCIYNVRHFQLIAIYCIGNLYPATLTYFYSRTAGIMAIYKTKPMKEEYFRVAQAKIKKHLFLRNPINSEVII